MIYEMLWRHLMIDMVRIWTKDQQLNKGNGQHNLGFKLVSKEQICRLK